jgi:hypothetical protein
VTRNDEGQVKGITYDRPNDLLVEAVQQDGTRQRQTEALQN